MAVHLRAEGGCRICASACPALFFSGMRCQIIVLALNVKHLPVLAGPAI
jgi:hypothetical protein